MGCGSVHTVAVVSAAADRHVRVGELDEEGDVWAWGGNTDGQLAAGPALKVPSRGPIATVTAPPPPPFPPSPPSRSCTPTCPALAYA